MAEQLTRRDVRRLRAGRSIALALAVVAALAGTASAASPVPLGTADSFAVLGGSTITNTGPTTITGDIGLCCTGLATPGFGSVTQPGGTQYAGPGTLAATAQDDLDIAYANAAAHPVTATLPVDLSLSGTPMNPLLPGVYESTSHGALQITSGLTLDFQGDPNAVFVFQGTALATAVGAGGSVNIVNGGSGASPCNVVWQLSDATQGVTLGTGSAFKGTTMALGASVLGSGATVQGRILTRRSKAVTLDTNTITRAACFAPAASGGGAATTTTSPGITLPAPLAPRPVTLPLGLPVSRPAPSGVARISRPAGSPTRPFTVAVTGRRIQSVVFYIDGRRVKTVRARPGRTKFTVRIDPRRQSRRLHRVTARVTFTAASRTRRSTVRLTYRRPAAVARAPRFAG